MKIAIISSDPIGVKMAGPGIRYWELAKFLSRNHNVVLVCPNQPEAQPDGFVLVQNDEFWGNVRHQIFDFVIGQNFEQYGLTFLNSHTRLIGDFYIPLLTESLDMAQRDRLPELMYERLVHIARLRLLSVDHILCASQRQRDLYFGMLLGARKFGLGDYRKTGPNAGISIVPFGLPNERPHHSRRVLKGVHPGIRPNDKVIIWNGGIWNWFDPLSLILAVDVLRKKRDDIKLYFMGIKHPSDDVPEMKMTADAIALAKKLGLYDTCVFFNMDWVDYDDRQNYLSEADVSVCLAPQGLENDFSFRTRILDCFWAGIPTVINSGSDLSDAIEKYGAGMVVEDNDPKTVARAIELLLAAKPETFEAAFTKLNERYSWTAAFAPILAYIEQQPTAHTRPLGAKLAFFKELAMLKWCALRYKVAKLYIQKMGNLNH